MALVGTMLSEQDIVAKALTTVLVFSLITSLSFFALQGIEQKASADPSIVPGGKYTSILKWDFQNPSNYTATNVSLLDQEAKLVTSKFSLKQETKSDFDDGTFANTITTSDGNLTLSNLTMNAIMNGDFSSPLNWTFQSSPEGNVSAQWSSTDLNALFRHYSISNPPYFGIGNASLVEGTGATEPTGVDPTLSLQIDDGLRYTLFSGEYVIVKGFNASSLTGRIERVVLWAEYRIDPVVYEGFNSLMCKDKDDVWRRTDIIPLDGENSDVRKSYDITSFYSVWNQTVISSLTTKFENVDEAPKAHVEFDAIWLDVYLEPINETANVNQDIVRTERTGYKDTGLFDFTSAKNRTDLDLWSDPGNVTLVSVGERRTIELVQTAFNGKDSFIAGGSDSKNNYGSETQLEVFKTFSRRLLIEFDLTSIPADARVESAYVWLHMNNNTGLDRNIIFYRITQAWDEMLVTWEDPWTIDGGNYNSTPLASTHIKYSDEEGFFVGWDITNALRDWGAGAHTAVYPNCGMIGIIENADWLPNQKRFDSSETGVPLYAPKLVVTYSNLTYVPSAFLASRVLDAGRDIIWETISWTETIMPGVTELRVQTRTGSMPDPDLNPEAWEGWEPIISYGNPTGEQILSSPNRYLQYKVEFLTNNQNYTPVLSDITILQSDVEMSFDYIVENVVNINRVTLTAQIDGEEIWSADVGPMMSWATRAVDISDLLFDDQVHNIWLGVSLFSNTPGLTNVTARFDNIQIYNVLSGEYLSPVLGLGPFVNYENISWNDPGPPETNVVARTRVGNSSTPDANWSAWSPPYTIHTGSDIDHPSASFIQYELLLTTTTPGVRPLIDTVTIVYSIFNRSGEVCTKNFSPSNIVEWGIFNVSGIFPPQTNVRYFYSTNLGISWFEMVPGFNMSSVAIPNIQIKAELSTTVNETSPILHEMNLTFIHTEPLSQIEMSIATWGGTADETVDINAIGKDKYGKILTFWPYWSTTDPNGTVNSDGVYSPGRVGTWRVYCNNSDNSVSNYTTVSIASGNLAELGVSPWNPGTITADDEIVFNAFGQDADGNPISQTNVSWSVTNEIGSIDPGPASSTFFNATKAGTGRVIADDGNGHVNVTALITVIPGVAVDIAISPWDPGALTTDDLVLFTAFGEDSDDNIIGSVSVNWSVIGGIGNIPPGPSAFALFDPTNIGNGKVLADDGIGHTNSTVMFTVSAGEVATIDITPSYTEVDTDGKQNFTAEGFDADGNTAQLVTTVWSTNVGNIIQATATTATLEAQDTEQLGGWINASHGSVVGSAIVDVVEGLFSPKIVGIIPSQEKPEDYGSWSLDLSAFATDPVDESTLMWNLEDYDTSLFTVTGTNIEGNHILGFTTVENAYGSCHVKLVLVNSLDKTDSQMIWVNITPVNDHPVFTGAPDLFVRYDNPYDFDYTPYIADVDSDASGWYITTNDMNHTTVDGLIVTFSYPQSMVDQTEYVEITVWDGDGGWDTDIISVRVTSNYPPTLVKSLPDVVIYEGETLEDVFDLDEYIVDPDMNSDFVAIGYSHISVDIDEENVVDITADDQWMGIETVTFRAIDPLGGIEEDTIIVTVIGVNDAPEISGVPPLVIRYEYPFIFDLTPYISDVNNDTDDLVVTTSNPDNVTVDGFTLTLVYPEYWSGSRPYSVPLTIIVSDGLESSFQVITVTVTDNYPPTILKLLPDLTFDEDFEFEYAFDLDDYFIDTDGDTLFFVSGQEIMDVTIHPNHTVSLAAPLNWYGSEHVTFRAIDVEGAIVEDTIVIEVLPINDPPVLQTLPNQYVDTRQWTLDLTPYVSDVDTNISDLMVFTDSQYVYAESLMLFFDYPEGVSEESVQVIVGDGIYNTTKNIQVVIVGNGPTDWLSSNWGWVLILLTAVLSALGTAGYLLLKQSVIVEDLFLIHKNGLLLEHHTRRLMMTVDHDILSGMLTAISEFAKETFTYDEKGELRRMDLGDRTILLDSGRFVTVAIVLKGEEPENLSERLHKLIDDIEKTYPEIETWDGRVGAFKGLAGMLEGFVKGTYERRFWGSDSKKLKTLVKEHKKNGPDGKTQENKKRGSKTKSKKDRKT